MTPSPLFPTLGLPELLLILVIVLIFFGVGKLPEAGRALGEGIRNFRDAARSGGDGSGGAARSQPPALEDGKVVDAELAPGEREEERETGPGGAG